jgi:serine/threonine protein kinase
MEFFSNCKNIIFFIRSETRVEDRMNFANQIVAGMIFLTSANVVHRDLAARNIFMCMPNSPTQRAQLKIGNFELSAKTDGSNPYFRPAPERGEFRFNGKSCLFILKFSQ